MANLPITHHKLGPPIRIQATKIQEPPQPSVEIEVQVPKDVASMFVQEELNVEPKKQADEKKVLLENEKGRYKAWWGWQNWYNDVLFATLIL